MKIRVYDTYEQMSRAAADLITAQLLIKPNSRLGLTAGSTPIGMFAELVKLYREGSVSFNEAWLYNLEEKSGLPRMDEQTCRTYFHRHLLDHVDGRDDHLILPDSQAIDLKAESARYEEILTSLPNGRLDMQVLGIGSDAHIGMNRPNQTLEPRCHPESRESGMYIAMGVGTILQSERIVLLANGESKAQAVADMCGSKITTMVPASLLQLHADVTILLDKPAASKL